MTGYENYSRAQLHSFFSSDKWKTLDLNTKINVCQEIENRYAHENGVNPCVIRHESMNGSTYGYQFGNTITLNTNLLRDGIFVTQFKDSNGITQTVQTQAIAPSWNTLDTVYHEGTHGIQTAKGQIPHTYIHPSTDRDLYRIQAIEKEAYAMGQSKTLEAISEVEQYSGITDTDKKEYIEYVRMDSFNAALQDSIVHYNDTNIEQTLNTVIHDRDNGIIRTDYTQSYNAIYSLCDRQYLHTKAIDNSTEEEIGVSRNSMEQTFISDGSFTVGDYSQPVLNTAYDGMGDVPPDHNSLNNLNGITHTNGFSIQ